MQDVKGRPKLSIRPLFLLVSLAGFLLVYLAGVMRGQSLTWVTISSTVALFLLLVAGLVIESLLERVPPPEEGPAATYEQPSARRGEDRT
ncbi:MAG: hypothetical protein RMK01_04885 [Thermomicrobium sp.]|nr:hypothetical protein [Thermomicrobium sp.]MDW8059387.1 hypothetical protein [Thermomicrobium sp.]